MPSALRLRVPKLGRGIFLLTCVLAAVSLALGGLIVWNHLTDGNWPELVAVPLMSMLVLVMLWHAVRRGSAVATAEENGSQLELISRVVVAANEEQTVFGLAQRVGRIIAEHTGWELVGVQLVDLDRVAPYGGNEIVVPLQVEGCVLATISFSTPDAAGEYVRRADTLTLIRHQLETAADRMRVHARLQEEEQRYRTLVEELPLVTYTDLPDQITGATFVSRQNETLTGYSPEEWVADPDLFRKLLHPEDRLRVLGQMERLKRGEIERFDAEYRLIHRDGTVRWLEQTARNVRSESGRILYTQGYAQDISVRKQRDQMLADDNERLRDIERVKDGLITLVSHELRTPLTSVAGYLELILEDEDLIDDQVVEYLRIARRNAARLERLVDDLLFFAQFDAGRFSIVPGPVALDEVVADALRSARPLADSKQLTLTSDTSDLPEGLVGDRLRLGQVLDNLVSNAVKFTPDGGEISVTTRVDDDSVTISVADTGIGVPDGEQGQLFERFFRSSAATERAIQGTGLGLAISKTIVEAHGGTMAFVSKRDEGTTVAVTLPLAAVPARKLVAVQAL